jgi:hypothetical protein
MLRCVADRPVAYAVVLYSWPGNMNVRFHISGRNISFLLTIAEPIQHQGIKGLELVHGQVVVITGVCSDDWYYGHVPSGLESLIFPRDHVRILKYEVSVLINAPLS